MLPCMVLYCLPTAICHIMYIYSKNSKNNINFSFPSISIVQRNIISTFCTLFTE